MIEHNKDLFQIIQILRSRLSGLNPKSLDGREAYKQLLALYASLDVNTELSQGEGKL